jgi:copper chaperone CopZ
MALTVQEIDGHIAALQASLASGELTVEYDGRRVTYKDTKNLLDAINYYQRLRAQIPATGPAPSSADRGSYAAFERD